MASAPQPMQTHRTPTKSKKVRRRVDGSPVIPRDESAPTKTVFLIRHGQSLGQTARQRGINRTDQSLRDCGLTDLGIYEATHISEHLEKGELDSIELVISSPLTRALSTAVLGFNQHNILVHYDLREIGTKVPENVPRKMKDVFESMSEILESRSEEYKIDAESMQPADWPRDFSPSVVKRERAKQFLRWLYDRRTESTVAIVCHYNVIMSLLGGSIRPQNATPIKCTLYSNGELEHIHRQRVYNF